MAEDSFEKARKVFFASANEPPEASTSPVEFKASSEPPQKSPPPSFEVVRQSRAPLS